MFKITKLLAILMAVAVPFAAAASASADGETVSARTKVSPLRGKFHKKTRVASNLTVSAVVTPGASSPTVNPLKRVNLVFPAGTGLRPNRNVCPDSKLNPQSSLSVPKAVVARCSKAVVGTGTALIYLARLKAQPLDDPVLIVFNAGKTKKGQPKLKIYGFSKSTGVGVLMSGVLKGRKLSIAVPVLTSDSAVGNFKIQMPGPVLNRPDIGLKIKGKNPRYVQASCPHSPLVTQASFVLGQRDFATGQPIPGTQRTVASPKWVQKCVGRG